MSFVHGVLSLPYFLIPMLNFLFSRLLFPSLSFSLRIHCFIHCSILPVFSFVHGFSVQRNWMNIEVCGCVGVLVRDVRIKRGMSIKRCKYRGKYGKLGRDTNGRGSGLFCNAVDVKVSGCRTNGACCSTSPTYNVACLHV